jgi:hypothetical protein
MPFTHDTSSTDTSVSPTQTALDFPVPKDGHVAAVAVTVGVVGVFLFGLITWLVLRLRRRPADAAPSSHMQRIFTFTDHRPSTESKFSFSKFLPLQEERANLMDSVSVRRPSRVDHQQDDGSWDFSDPDPTHGFVPSTRKCQLPPLCTLPHSNRSSIYKGEVSPRSVVDSDLETPPPVYCRDGSSSPLYSPPKYHLPRPAV